MSVTAESGFGDSPRRIDLRVPHHWQLSEYSGVRAEEARRICAPVCLKTVLDFKFFPSGESAFSLSDVIERTVANGGRSENGWLHNAEVATLRGFGLNAWRRDWQMSRLRSALAYQREDYDRAQISAASVQQNAEAAMASTLAKSQHSIEASLSEGNPVIASVAPGFSQNKAAHQIVIHGYEEGLNGASLLITDPIIEDKAHQERLIEWDYFAHFFHQRAIFVSDK